MMAILTSVRSYLIVLDMNRVRPVILALKTEEVQEPRNMASSSSWEWLENYSWLLQAAYCRRSKTNFISCPSCGRTLYDIQQVMGKIKARFGHLSDISIGIMGCIVNGPGEMADADFGYVGGGPGRITLFEGKTAVKKNIPEEDAIEELVNLIKERGRWQEP